MAAAQNGFIEVINTAVDPVFTNTAEDDIAFYTESSNQAIHFGTTKNASSTLRLVGSNAEFAGNLVFNGTITTSNTVVFNGLKFGKPPVGAGSSTILQQVTSVAGLNNNANNFAFQLSNAQSDFRFLSATGTPLVAMSNNGDIAMAGNVTLGTTSAPGNIAAGNLGMFRNRIINGDMAIDQRNAGALVTDNNEAYVIDRFKINCLGGATLTASRTDISYAVPGFRYAYSVTVATSTTTIGANDVYLLMVQNIEGLNVSDLMWGNANAQSITVSFWFKSTVSHTYYLTLMNSDLDRSFVAPFTTSANTWQYFTIIIPGDTTGAWASDNTIGIRLNIYAAAGSAISTNTANAWDNGFHRAITGSTSTFIGTSGNNVMITGLQLEKGTLATPFEFRPHPIELQLCQRYYNKTYNVDVVPGTATWEGAVLMHYNAFEAAANGYKSFPTPMRSIPTITFYDPSNGALNTARNFSNNASNVVSTIISTIPRVSTVNVSFTCTSAGHLYNTQVVAISEL